MATPNAPFYSCRAGRLDTIKSHRSVNSAMAAAGECGQIWITETASQQQIHKTIMGSWEGFEPDNRAVDMKIELIRLGFIGGAEGSLL